MDEIRNTLSAKKQPNKFDNESSNENTMITAVVLKNAWHFSMCLWRGMVYDADVVH